MIDLFECCGEIASVGIIVDFSEDTETYIVGTPADIKAWACAMIPVRICRIYQNGRNRVHKTRRTPYLFIRCTPYFIIDN